MENSLTEFSMDFSLFARLDYLFQRLDNATLTLDLYKWYNLTLVLYKEIAPLIKEEDRPNYIKKIDLLLPEFVKLKKAIDNDEDTTITISLYKELQAFEISLRDVVEKKGAYIRKKEDRASGFGG